MHYKTVTEFLMITSVPVCDRSPLLDAYIVALPHGKWLYFPWLQLPDVNCHLEADDPPSDVA